MFPVGRAVYIYYRNILAVNGDVLSHLSLLTAFYNYLLIEGHVISLFLLILCSFSKSLMRELEAYEVIE